MYSSSWITQPRHTPSSCRVKTHLRMRMNSSSQNWVSTVSNMIQNNGWLSWKCVVFKYNKVVFLFSQKNFTMLMKLCFLQWRRSREYSVRRWSDWRRRARRSDKLKSIHFLLFSEQRVIFCSCPLLRIVSWPRGWKGWSCRQTWSSSRVIGAAWTHLRPTWRTKCPSWLMRWRTAVNKKGKIFNIILILKQFLHPFL